MKEHDDFYCCQLFQDAVYDEEVAMGYWARFREYGIDTKGSDIARHLIYYCPWCSQKLPGSLRVKCVEELEKLGFELFDENIPEEYKTDEWWREKYAAG